MRDGIGHGTRSLHPRHGPHDPTTATPPQRRGALRRTTTIDLLRPAGLDGDVIVDGRGRDLLLAGDGRARVVGESGVRARLDFMGGCALLEIETDPPVDAIQELLGAAVASGFRAKVGAAVPEEAAGRTLLHLLLDDMPGAVLVSGYALHTGGGAHDMRADRAAQEAFLAGRANLCAGFATDATMLSELAETGIMPMPQGPAAPALESPEHPPAWHDHGELPPGGIRRRRRMDVLGEGERLRVDAMFRDTHRDPAGVETIIHEYVMTAEIDRADLRVLSIDATPRVLPWVECPRAAGSAQSLVGQTVHELRTWVRARLQGTATCTHLNDLLRSLADLDRLESELGDGAGSGLS
ncbi:DUF2889 domain-containing protein [Actinomadura sp. SCN-SB]|uniref:DUF2889 domain-containing protein n=1 Tax=Actinomadura sp. SCN-SB TaxID=3373092 RepID=UPI0037515BE0